MSFTFSCPLLGSGTICSHWFLVLLYVQVFISFVPREVEG